VMLVNDEFANCAGTLTLTLESKSGEAARVRAPFQVGALGQTTLYIDLDVPDVAGDFVLQAKADGGRGAPTLSRRRVTITAR